MIAMTQSFDSRTTSIRYKAGRSQK